MNTVKAKFTCTKAAKTTNGTEVTFWALYSNNPEDNSYSQATPSGQITMHVTNPSAESFFVEGQKYFLDFKKAE